MLAFAGIFQVSAPPDAELIWSYAVIMGAPAPSITPMHAQMPAILDREARARWLDPLMSTRELLHLLRPRAIPLRAMAAV
jgi:putative SOS response-associated peptidase YedK